MRLRRGFEAEACCTVAAIVRRAKAPIAFALMNRFMVFMCVEARLLMRFAMVRRTRRSRKRDDAAIYQENERRAKGAEAVTEASVVDESTGIANAESMKMFERDGRARRLRLLVMTREGE